MARTRQMHTARHYDLGPTQLSLEADHGDLIDGFERFLGDRSRPDTGASTFSVTIRRAEPEPIPSDAELLYGGPLPYEGRCDFARTRRTYIMSFPGEARMVVDLDARWAEIAVSPDHPWRAYGSLVPIAIEFALDLDDQHIVHAAGLSVPGEDGMVLVSAPSGTGKTTTALALARRGLSLAADDVVVLRREGAGIVAWGLPRALNVHRDTAAMLPWLGLRPRWNDQGEQMVPRASLGPMIALEDRELPVARLLLLQRGEHVAVEPLSAAETLASLAADNVRGSLAGITPLQQRRFDMLADLAGTLSAERVTIPDGAAGIEAAARLFIETR